MIINIFLLLFLIAITINCGYGLYFFLKLRSFPTKSNNNLGSNSLPVSIVICAKNESDNLKKYLPSILQQVYKAENNKQLFEVIVVDDCSTDDTESVVNELIKQFHNLHFINGSNGKKQCIKQGVSSAKYDIILFTDADCKPLSHKWLQNMVEPINDKTEIVAGYSGYNYTSSLLNLFIRCETIHTFLLYGSFIKAGKPYMAVGRNLAVKKGILMSIFDNKQWNNLPYGDDDMLVSIFGNHLNTALICNTDAFTYSDSKQNLKDYFNQKQRHLSTGKYYKTDIKLLIGCYGFSHAILWICLMVLLLFGYFKIIATAIFIRYLIYCSLWYKLSKETNEKQLIYFFPVFDIGWLMYNFAFSPYLFFKNKKHWK